MIKRIALAFSLALVLVLSLASAAFASAPRYPDFSVEWDGDEECGVVYGVAASIEGCGSYTEFATTGVDIYGDFDANVYDCGKIVSDFDAKAEGNCEDPGTISYKTVAWNDSKVQKLAFYAQSDCEAEMNVDSKAECGQLDSCFRAEVDGCEGVIDLLALVSGVEKDAKPDAILAVKAYGNSGFDAELKGEVDSCDNEAEAKVDIYSEDGKGGLTMFGAGEEVELDICRGEIEVDKGHILLDVGWGAGVDLDDIEMSVEW